MGIVISSYCQTLRIMRLFYKPRSESADEEDAEEEDED